MSRALRMSPEARTRTVAVVRDMGRVFRAARIAAGEAQKNAAYRVGVDREVVSRFENGHVGNPAIGNVVRLLSAYDLTLAVVSAKENP